MQKLTLPSGIHYLVDGFALLFKPGLRRFFFLPLLVNVFIFLILFVFLNHYFNQFDTWFEQSVPAWLVWLETLIWLVFLLGFFIVFVSGFTVVMTIIAAPFNSILSEKAELVLGGKPLPEEGLLGNLKDMPRVFGRQFSIILYYLPRALGLLLLFLVPVINLLAPFICFLFNAWFFSMQFLDFPSDNHRVPIRKVRQAMAENRWYVLSFGVGVLFALMIPVVNLCTMPAAVIGATLLWRDIYSED